MCKPLKVSKMEIFIRICIVSVYVSGDENTRGVRKAHSEEDVRQFTKQVAEHVPTLCNLTVEIMPVPALREHFERSGG